MPFDFNTLASDMFNASAANGSQAVDQCFADVWLSDSVAIDFSVANNRNKFLPTVSKGANGELPTGSSPNLYFGNKSTATWGTNLGTGGGFTQGGTIAAASSNPS